MADFQKLLKRRVPVVKCHERCGNKPSEYLLNSFSLKNINIPVLDQTKGLSNPEPGNNTVLNTVWYNSSICLRTVTYGGKDELI